MLAIEIGTCLDGYVSTWLLRCSKFDYFANNKSDLTNIRPFVLVFYGCLLFSSAERMVENRVQYKINKKNNYIT